MTDLEALTEELMKIVDAAGLRAVIILVDGARSCLMTNMSSKDSRETLEVGAQFVEHPLPNLGEPN